MQVIAVVEDLIELFGRPWRRMLCSKVIKHEDAGISDLLESLVIGRRLVRRKRGSQIVEQIRHNSKEREKPLILEQVVRNSCSKMGLPASVLTDQQNPAVRIPCIVEARLIGFLNARNERIEAIECQVLQMSKAAEFLIQVPLKPLSFLNLALAGNKAAKIRVAVWDIEPKEARALTDRARLALVGRAARISR